MLAGWKYHVLGPTMLEYSKLDWEHRLRQILFLGILSKHMPDNVTVVYADAFDVLFQGSKSNFTRKYEEMNPLSDKIIYSVERNCWPFKRYKVDDWYNCPSMLGPDYIDAHTGSNIEGTDGVFSLNDVRPLGCKFQDDIAGTKNLSRYLNSGLRYTSIFLNFLYVYHTHAIIILS